MTRHYSPRSFFRQTSNGSVNGHRKWQGFGRRKCQGQRAGSAVVMAEPRSLLAIRRPICFRITLWWSCVGGPPPLRSHSFSIPAYSNVTLKWTPKPLQRSGSSPRTHNPGTERDRRGSIRHHGWRIEPIAGGGASGAALEGQTEGALNPCRRQELEANTKRRKSSRNRFPRIKTPGNRFSR